MSATLAALATTQALCRQPRHERHAQTRDIFHGDKWPSLLQVWQIKESLWCRCIAGVDHWGGTRAFIMYENGRDPSTNPYPRAISSPQREFYHPAGIIPCTGPSSGESCLRQQCAHTKIEIEGLCEMRECLRHLGVGVCAGTVDTGLRPQDTACFICNIKQAAGSTRPGLCHRPD